MNKDIDRLLYSIGLTANYTGYRQIAIALELAVAEPDTLLMVTKRLYPEIAQRCGTTWKAVERNIRAMLVFTWDKSRGRLEQISGPLDSKPTPAQFLAILTYYLTAEP